jgi:hypothetical protein
MLSRREKALRDGQFYLASRDPSARGWGEHAVTICFSVFCGAFFGDSNLSHFLTQPTLWNFILGRRGFSYYYYLCSGV